MIFSLSPYEKKIFQVIREAAESLGAPCFVVGGYVRDKLLGRASPDIDILAVGNGIALAQEVASRLYPIPRISIFQRFGTAQIIHGSLNLEFVGARKESYREDSRKPMVEDGSLEDDLRRRDFTINAMAVSLNEDDFGQLIDMFDGMRHLEMKLIKTPLEPERTFSDDPLRMLRAIRFANQLEYNIDSSTFQGIIQSADRISIISMERISIELEKIMLCEHPSIGFKLLHQAGLLKHLLPELTALEGVEYIDGKGHKDNFYHTLMVLDNVAVKSENIWLRWAALFHDIGKPATKRFNGKQGWTFHGHDLLGASMLPRIFKRLRLPADHRLKYVQNLVRLHLRPISLTKEEITASAIRRVLFEAGGDIDDLMILCEADITSKKPEKVKNILENYQLVRSKMIEIEQKDQLRNWQPPIDGQEIMETFGLKPSLQVGTIKLAIREAILDGKIENDYKQARSFMLEEAARMGLKPLNPI
ncbi:MAG: HD domain-containing protein [Saprospiraceae bacterium]|nr:HD domain-containing protein [Saprospiraceae bacterium]